MNKIIKVFVVGVLFATTASSQTIYDAAKFVDQDLNGTARLLDGGSYGSLGGIYLLLERIQPVLVFIVAMTS